MARARTNPRCLGVRALTGQSGSEVSPSDLVLAPRDLKKVSRWERGRAYWKGHLYTGVRYEHKAQSGGGVAHPLNWLGLVAVE